MVSPELEDPTLLDQPKAIEIRPKCYNHLATQTLVEKDSKFENK